eukprot:9780870-Prorocentrum_lima.AAC.1
MRHPRAGVAEVGSSGRWAKAQVNRQSVLQMLQQCSGRRADYYVLRVGGRQPRAVSHVKPAARNQAV